MTNGNWVHTFWLIGRFVNLIYLINKTYCKHIYAIKYLCYHILNVIFFIVEFENEYILFVSFDALLIVAFDVLLIVAFDVLLMVSFSKLMNPNTSSPVSVSHKIFEKCCIKIKVKNKIINSVY